LLWKNNKEGEGNPSYSAHRDQEDGGSKPASGKQFIRPYLKKIHHKKKAGIVAQVVEHLSSKHEALSTAKKKKKREREKETR
jgi:hypothetical protein